MGGLTLGKALRALRESWLLNLGCLEGPLLNYNKEVMPFRASVALLGVHTPTS